jgi:hypothetical protein
LIFFRCDNSALGAGTQSPDWCENCIELRNRILIRKAPLYARKGTGNKAPSCWINSATAVAELLNEYPYNR